MSTKRTRIDGLETAGRDAKGRFQRGHKGGPGRPKRATEAEYLDALKASVPLERWQRVIEAAAVAAALAAVGALRCDADGTRTVSARLPGIGKQRVYAIGPRIWDAAP
jgi:hypothetical protein